jgi:hypothetical protein
MAEIPLPPPIRLHRQIALSLNCKYKNCSRQTSNQCGYCSYHEPPYNCGYGNHYSPEVYKKYIYKCRIYELWHIVYLICQLKRIISRYRLRIALKIYSPGEIGYITAKDNFLKHVSESNKK